MSYGLFGNPNLPNPRQVYLPIRLPDGQSQGGPSSVTSGIMDVRQCGVKDCFWVLPGAHVSLSQCLELC